MERGSEIIYGTNPVLEALKAARRRVQEVYIAQGRREKDAGRVEEEAARRGVSVKKVPKEELGRLAHSEKHQGIAARCDPYPYSTLDEIIGAALKDERKGFLLFLDGVTDPQNLGSLIRTSHLMGVHGVILPKDNAAQITPAVLKASAGSTEYQRVVHVTNLARTITYIKERGFWVIAAEGMSDDAIYLHDFTGYNVAVVLGAEGAGIRRLVRDKCDYRLSIPMEGVVASYNVSVAGAVFMGEIARQRWMRMHAKSVPK